MHLKSECDVDSKVSENPCGAAGRVAASVSVLAVVGALAAGCLERPIEPVEPRTTKIVVDQLPVPIDRLDVLLAIDDSSSMRDKQLILASAVPKLVDRLVNPSCITKDGALAATQPDKPGDPCPDGAKREFKPLADINVGIVTSSLGDMNGGGCSGAAHVDDAGHLVSRSATGGVVDTYRGQGFLAWDPSPGKRGGIGDQAAFQKGLTDLVAGVGQDGCGYEMQLESVVRFLVDPAPYASLERIPGGAGVLDTNRKSAEIDQLVLTQRAEFLRPDSLVAILMLTDENDCSFIPDGPGFNLMQNQPFFKASSACANDPNDACCYSCGQKTPPAGCPVDPACAGAPRYAANEDPQGLHCFDQKRRYGIDFLYPIERYVNAFTQKRIDPARADLAVTSGSTPVDNPLLSNLTGEKVATRTADRIFFAGIVGVPWQAIARAGADGKPDVHQGFKSYDELVADKAFDALVGDPSRHVPPTDPFMVESPTPRQGTSDLLQASPSAANGINGTDHDTQNQRLEYACVFDLDCGASCGNSDCADDPSLCEAGKQTRAKAYPGLRQLAVLEGMKGQGIVASVCPADLSNPSDVRGYGYDPAVNAIVDQLKYKLAAQCLPTKLTADPKGQVSCLAIEARTLADGETCSCDGAARRPVQKAEAIEAVRSEATAEASWDCFCEITQVLDEAQRTACQSLSDDDVAKVAVDGWCYLDATTNPPIGDPDLLSSCRPDEKHAVRFVNHGEPVRGARAIITCASE